MNNVVINILLLVQGMSNSSRVKEKNTDIMNKASNLFQPYDKIILGVLGDHPQNAYEKCYKSMHQNVLMQSSSVGWNIRRVKQDLTVLWQWMYLTCCISWIQT